jgi:hypothetical protein
MDKAEAQVIFDAYFQGEKAIYSHFGVEDFATWDYELQRNYETWAVVGESVYWELPEDEDKDGEAVYNGELRAIYRKEHFTLIFTPSCTGHAGFALIFDNTLETKDYEPW